MIVAFLDQDHRDWDEHLRDFRFAYNTAHHSSIGTSPAFLNLGRKLKPLHSLRARCLETIEVEPWDPVTWTDRMKKLRVLYEWIAGNLE